MKQTAIQFINQASDHVQPEWVEEHGQRCLESLKRGTHPYDVMDELKGWLGDKAEGFGGHLIITIYEIMEANNLEWNYKPRYFRNRQ